MYGAALYLNPGKLHPLIRDHEDATVGQLRGYFLDVLGRMVEDEETRSKIDAQSLDYEPLEERHSQTNWPSKTLRQTSLVSVLCNFISKKF